MYLHVLSKNYICYIYIYIHMYVYIYIYITKTELFKSNLRSRATAVVPGTHTDGKVPQKPFRVLSASVLRSKGQCFSRFFKYESMKWFKINDILWSSMISYLGWSTNPTFFNVKPEKPSQVQDLDLYQRWGDKSNVYPAWSTKNDGTSWNIQYFLAG